MAAGGHFSSMTPHPHWATTMEGFLPFSRASFMLDFVAVAMVVIVPVMLWSIWLVKSRRNYALHKRVQVALGLTLLVAVVLFEVDMRVNGWRQYAAPSPYYGGALTTVLIVHLFFSISTSVLWVWTIVGALRRFEKPPAPGPYSPRHRRLGRLTAAFTCGTAVTGWVFYYMAFVA